MLRFSKIKSAEMSEFKLINLVGISELWVALFSLRLLISFTFSSRSFWKKWKKKVFALFLYCIYAWMGLYFIIWFIHGSLLFRLSCSAPLYWGIPGFVMMLEKKLLKIFSVFLTLSTMVLSSRKGILSLETFLFDNRFYYTPKFFNIT